MIFRRNLIMSDKKETKKALKKQRADAIPTPTRKIDYQVDTLSKETPTIAYFHKYNNTITVNYQENVSDTPLEQSKAVKAHEQKHRDNQAAGIDNMPMSLEQYYKTEINNEISATIAELLQIRMEYINAKTEEERTNILSRADASKFYYYTNAIRSGDINPLAQNLQDFEKEMKFIAQKTQYFWMENFADSYDKNQLYRNTLGYMAKHDYDELKDNHKNYEKARKIAYTIGGLNFSQYINDISCINENIKKADKMIVANKPRKDIEKIITPEEKRNWFDLALVNTQTTATTLKQQATLTAYSEISRDFENTIYLRKRWLNCNTDQERAEFYKDTDYLGPLSKAWLQALKEEKIHPQIKILTSAEEKLMGEIIKKETGKAQDVNLWSIKDYLEYMDPKELHQAVKSGQADKNYQRLLKNMFSIYNTDLSAYVQTPKMDLSILNIADQKIRNNQKVDPDLDIQEPDSESYISIPKITPNPNLSMEQQLRLAQHKMFVENALLHNNEFRQQLKKDAELEKHNKTFLETTYTFNNPTADLTLNSQPEVIIVPFQPYEDAYKEERLKQIISPYDKISNSMEYNLKGIVTDYTLKNFQINLKYNSELQEKWQKAEKILASQIAENYKDALILPKANEALYQQELNKIYTIEGFNLKDELKKQYGKQKNIEENIATIKSPEIEKVQSTTTLSRVKTKARNTYHKVKNTALKKTEEVKSWATKKTKETTDWLTNKWNIFTNLLPNKKSPPKDYRKKKISSPTATIPQYKVWSPQQRVSPVLQEEIYDMTAPFLKQQQELLAQKDPLIQRKNLTAQNKLKTEKLNRKLKNKEKTQTVSAKKNISKNITTQPVTKTTAISQHEHN